MKFLLTVLGVVLVFEGLPWFLSPRGVRRMLEQMAKTTDHDLRLFGLVSMLVGLGLVYLATR